MYGSDLPKRLPGVLCRPTDSDEPFSIAWAERIINASDWPLLPNLVPIMALDERSFVCVVASSLDDDIALPGEGAVVRWHLDVTKDEHQAAILDTNCLLYIESVAEELEAREEGLSRVLEEMGPAYELQYLEVERRPRDFVFRPVRIACQNVAVALGAFAHDSSFDGLSVVAWQTCEVPHVAAHEASRALTALMLCDAFQSGGTMEIRFDQRTRLRADGTTPKSGQHVQVDKTYHGHPERQVPASLRRFGRTVGVPLGQTHNARITPEESRRLFKAITPMPTALAMRVDKAVAEGVATPERLCFTLLSQIWREVELDFMLAVSPRTGSIISGGAPHDRRAERQTESEVTRAALMLGMYFRRLDSSDGAGATKSEARVLEDNRVGVSWEVLPDIGGVRFSGLRSEPLPWQDIHGSSSHVLNDQDTLIVLPRLAVDSETSDLAAALAARASAAVVVPSDARTTSERLPSERCFLLRCPAPPVGLDTAAG
ncbi:MAG: hypothetical protein ITG02_00885, partial [Patulibacter sp.]|nr:hypothetical protein [Patulibacter sp.]